MIKKITLLKGCHIVVILFLLLFMLHKPAKAGVYYWVGGTGNWSQYNTHWATSSNGLVFHIQSPTPSDTVIFDSHSFATTGDTVFIDSTLITCHDMIWTNVTNHPVFVNQYFLQNNNFKLYGSLTLSSNMLWAYGGNMYFEATSGLNTITSATQNLGILTFEGIGGSWKLLDSLHSAVAITAGTFSTNNQKVNGGFNVYPPAGVAVTVYLGTSLINSNQSWNITGGTVYADSATIICGTFRSDVGSNYYNVTSNQSNFVASNCNFNVVTILGGGISSSTDLMFKCNIDSLVAPQGFAASGGMCDINYTTVGQSFDLTGSGNIFQYLQVGQSANISGNNNFHYTRINDDAHIYGNNIFDTLLFNNPSHVIILGANDTLTINNALIANGTCSSLTNFISSSAGTQATILKSSGAVTLGYILLQDIKAIGGAVFTANNSTAVSNVTGFTVNAPAPQNLYWVGGQGHWNDANHWATTSGGAGGSCVPSPVDNVFFDANSFTTTGDTVLIDFAIVYCKNMDWTGVTNNPVFDGRLISQNNIFRLYGSLTLSQNMLWSYSGKMYFEATSGMNTITSATQNLGILTFEGIGGSWKLLDSLHSAVAITAGTFSTNNQKVNGGFNVYPPAGVAVTVYLGTSLINSNQSWNITGGTVYADSATIICGTFRSDVGSNYYNVTSNQSNFVASNCNFNVVTILGGGISSSTDLMFKCNIDSLVAPQGFAASGGMCDINYTTVGQSFDLTGSGNISQYLQVGQSANISGNNNFHYTRINDDAHIYGNNIFDTLLFNNPSHVIILGANDTLTINNALIANGTCSSLTNFISSSAGTQATILKSSGAVTLGYILLQDIKAIGGAVFTANNSTAVSNVTGFTVNAPAPQNLYWVGGKGHWNDANHWATTSGGAGGSCVPSPVDNVFFDANSFTTTGDTVLIDFAIVYCKNMDWTGVTNNPVFDGRLISQNNIFRLYGSLTLSQNMLWSYSGKMYFEATSGMNTITSATQNLGILTFEGIGGSWKLLDSLHSAVAITAGTFSTNNQKVNGGFNVYPPAGVAVTVYLGTSLINSNQSWNITGGTVYADSATIICGTFRSDVGSNYYNMTSNQSNFVASNCNFNVVTILGGGISSSTDLMFKCNIDSLVAPQGFAASGGMCDINYTTVGQSFDLTGSGNIFQYLQVGQSANISGNNNFHYTRINDDAHIYGNNIFDTLYLNNPGHIVVLGANDTLTINNVLEINASGGFPVALQSSVAGTQATIFKASDTVCVNYIYMQDINAIGGAQFYAGLYSSNTSNNTGWQFANCMQPISNVWPGDANNDLMTDNLDVIYIGIAYNETGFVRPSASLTYTAQPCLDWNRVFTNLANIKHADCDGNGIIDATDTAAVALNYGIANTGRLAAPQTQQTNSSNADLYFAPTQSTYLPGSFVSVPIDLGTTITPAASVYGLAFTVQYDATKIQAGSVGVSYNNSWVVPNSNLVHLEKDFYTGAHVDIGMARTNQTNVSGNGTIAYLNFKVAANATNGPINLAFSNVTVMDVNQTLIPVNSLGNSVAVGIDNVAANVSNVNVYPNPLAGETNISYSLANASFVEVSVYTPEGMLVATIETKTQTAGQHNLIWDASEVASGVYFCKIKCSDGEKVIKLIKVE